MQWVRLSNSDIVAEIIPPEASVPSVTHWYGEEFADRCIEATDDVGQGWFYDRATNTFNKSNPNPTITEPEPEPDPIEFILGFMEG